jgi:hypothetical protein
VYRLSSLPHTEILTCPIFEDVRNKPRRKPAETGHKLSQLAQVASSSAGIVLGILFDLKMEVMWSTKMSAFTKLHSITTQKTVLFILTTVRPEHPLCVFLYCSTVKREFFNM